VPQDLKVLKVIKVPKVLWDHKELQDLRGLKEALVLREPLDQQVM
jgi:hypothetical protein